MNQLIDKVLIFGISLLFTIVSKVEVTTGLVIGLIIAITCSALCSFFSNRETLTQIIVLAYVVVSIILTPLLLFMPLLAYDIHLGKKALPLAAITSAIYIYSISQQALPLVLPFAMCFLSFLLSFRTKKYIYSQSQFYRSQNRTREVSLALASKNQHLVEKQDYQVNMATLRERNRIAREIHDNVGHLITRSIMQTKALEVTCQSQNPSLEDLSLNLQSVNQTLVDAMESIRQSVHHIHDDSIDIKVEMETLVNNFTFCPVSLNIDEGDLPLDVRYCFIAIAKEALSNTAKHSNATFMTISIIIHPGFYQLICKDNGSPVYNSSKDKRSGIGLQNIKDRAQSLGGVVAISKTSGFRLFVSIPVKGTMYEDQNERKN